TEENLPRIFDPFFSTKTSTPRQGMGLGLSVSRSLIEAMGGSIDVMSAPGSGTCFTASFPQFIQQS
ncbi:MAG TPA: PAS domain-containing sensor histidine kinase, partial [Planctomycetaceae bacterium]|nr:PAS domain-containing sensor histidine kinase [Planctomycetaceae bacterium]